METRSRKRAEASSSAPSSQTSPVTRRAKRSRTATASSQAPPALSTRSRRSQNLPLSPPSFSSSAAAAAATVTAPPMDSSAGDSIGRRRRSSGKSHQSSADRDRDAADRGKEAGASRSRDRDRDAERMLGLSFDGGGADDDNDGEGSLGILHQNLTSASSALQGLLRKLGAGFDDLLPPSALSASSSQQSGRLKKILAGLRADGEEDKQFDALNQLCEMLSIGTEDSLGSIAMDSFVPVLVGLLNHESNPDIMLLAARALTYLCDVLPASCTSVVRYGAVPCFCARLLTIEYMDLAEQSLQALKKISQEHPTACLRAGALMAVLSYLDFFSTGVQRVALSTAANMCKKLPSDAADFVMEAIPLLTNLLNYHDAKVVEHASVCLTRIAEAFASCPDKLDELCNHGLLAQAAGLISLSNSGGQVSLSTSTYTGLIRLLSTCASGSPLAAKSLLLLGISGTLKDILLSSALVSGSSVSPAMTRPPEQVYATVNLVDELLPSLPIGTVSLPMLSNVLVKGTATKNSLACTSSKHDGSSETTTEVSAHGKLLQEQPELLQQFGMDLLPVIIQVYSSSISGPVRHKCLSIIAKLMYFNSADMIQTLLTVANISSFIAGILACKDPQLLIPALQIAEILMDKLPGTFSKMFVREGVVHAVDALILLESSSVVPSLPPISEKDSDPSPGIPWRSRRNQRRNGASNTENNSPYDSKGSISEVSNSPTTSEAPLANLNFRSTVSSLAKAFKDKYFPVDADATEAGFTEDLIRLKNLCSKLNAIVENAKKKTKGKAKASGVYSFDLSASNEEQLNEVIAEMLFELQKGDGVSTFEFIGSGVVLALLDYFTCGTFEKEKVSEANLPKFRQQALRRYKCFVATALPLEPKDGSKIPMSILVQKLQNALSSLEHFPVAISPLARSSYGSARFSSGLGALCHPFKLRLCRAQGEKSLRDYSSNVVLIDPLASLAAVEDFLWPRVQRSDSAHKSSSSAGNSDPVAAVTSGSAAPTPSTPGHRPSTRSRSSVTIGVPAKKDVSEVSASSSKGKGKAVVKCSADESRGPQTRNAARRRAASDKETEIKTSHSESTSEWFMQDELDMSPVEMDDTLMLVDDDISDEEDDHEEVLRDDSLPVCIPDKVHDVKLGDASDEGAADCSATDNQVKSISTLNDRSATERATESSEFRRGSVFGSRGAMSFAAAAMAGLASIGGRGIRVGRDYRGLASGSSSSDHQNKLIFTVGGKQLSKHLTIYQAFQRQLNMDEDDDEKLNGSEFPSDDNSFWSDIFMITYQKADGQAEKTSQGCSNSSKSFKPASTSDFVSHKKFQGMSLLDSILQGELPCDLEKNNPTYNVLALLRVLDSLNQLSAHLRTQAITDDFAEGKISNLDEIYRNGPKVSPEEFVNRKLTPKLARQMQDALALCSGSLPPWCYQLTKACPFLFPFDTRRQYFYSTAFGLSRALHRLQQQQNSDNQNSTSEREVRVGRLQRQKVRIARNRILDSAVKVMTMYVSQKAVLEVEYFGEVGTGLGPTLEFYTLLSHDLQKVELGLWRTNTTSESSVMLIDVNGTDSRENDDSLQEKKAVNDLPVGRQDIVQSPLGLFPRPWPPGADASDGSQFSKVIEYFRLVGQTMAKALQDGRLLDLPLSMAFYKLVLGQELELHDILLFDAEFGKILQELQALVLHKQFLDSNAGNNQMAIADLHFQGASIEDLCLYFTLPGYPEYILKDGGENIMVDVNNLEEYVSLVVDATIKTGIIRQIEAFRTGFNQVFDISSLQIFSPHELDILICGRIELWEPDSLVDNIKFDHGYTAKSPAIINLLEIMGEFTAEQQHAFCQFVTGAPRLPPGGLAALNPKLTIVRKLSAAAVNPTSNENGVSESVDDDLPSVMTCANYLKLPPYSTKEIMHKRILYAISEGQGSFDLS
ncbi:E3 ubiquitin-protein ligase UPL3-like isoform X1 [Zingiber officinale]|uniref:E3 ubiquitin-protein ligase UPL3-like isoform X1 n=1 Tax=Zingiber officinale TaxID=94328 RepID=UPI001C4C2673|nr:E3 ubiquitin-protein ligase UPL3-like isoform X1 [Zingiber officinale]